MAAIEWGGWHRYCDSGAAHRLWKFTEDRQELKAKEGQWLHDRGPKAPQRFVVRAEKYGKWVAQPSTETVEDCLFANIPLAPWRPPTETDDYLKKGFDGLGEAIQEVANAIRASSLDSRKVREIERIMDGGTAKKEKPSTVQNQFVRLKGEFSYDNGNPYTDWELLVDVPEIPVTRVSGLTPMHAAKGDVLREDDQNDELEPFKLRRNGSRIGDPEWWQVRHLFYGLKDGVESAEPAPPPEHGQALSDVEGGCPRSVHLVEEDIPELDIRAGDLIVNVYAKDDFPTMRGRVRYLSLEDYATLREVVEQRKFGVLFTTLKEPFSSDGLSRFLRDRKRWGQRLKVWFSRVAVVRPYRESVSRPIRAKSDAEAVFELLYQVTRSEGSDA